MDIYTANGYYYHKMDQQKALVTEFAERFPDLELACPAGYGHGETMTVAEFANTEQGTKYLGNIALGFNTLEQSDMGIEQALTIAGAGAFVRNEEGQIFGLEKRQPMELTTTVESKKKLS